MNRAIQIIPLIGLVIICLFFLIFILGFAHKDDLNDSKKYLEEEGNPYSYVGIDKDGKIAFDFGVFGLPETFIINKDGDIIYKHIGPLTKKIIEDEIAILF